MRHAMQGVKSELPSDPASIPEVGDPAASPSAPADPDDALRAEPAGPPPEAETPPPFPDPPAYTKLRRPLPPRRPFLSPGALACLLIVPAALGILLALRGLSANREPSEWG